MCYLLSVALPSRMIGSLTAAPPDLTVTEMSNSSMSEYVPAGFSWYVVTESATGCSCRLFKDQREDMERRDRTIAARRRRYNRKGWTSARINRALSQAVGDHIRRGAEPGLRADIRMFLADLAEHVGQVAVLVHWYDDGLGTERIVPVVGPSVSSDLFRSGEASVHADEIYTVQGRINTRSATP